MVRSRPERVKPLNVEPENLYHWSPRERRPSILRLGLVPGRLSRCGNWRPPYVAFSDEPVLAWRLSGALDDGEGWWDLWQVETAVLHGYEVIFDHDPDTGQHFPKEFRVYERTYKRDVVWVAERRG